MTRDRERILGLVGDRLCGELNDAAAAELEACLAARPDLAGAVARLEASWEALGLLDTACPLGAGEHAALLRRLFARLRGGRRLADEEIEYLAAAPIPRPEAAPGGADAVAGPGEMRIGGDRNPAARGNDSQGGAPLLIRQINR